MRQNGGIGIAAPQCGVSLAVAIVEDGDHTVTLVNPKLIDGSEEVTSLEGCLSYPGLIVDKKRFNRVTIAHETLTGAPTTTTFVGRAAHCAQHEIDHLMGVCIIDGLSALKLERARRKGSKVHVSRSQRK